MVDIAFDGNEHAPAAFSQLLAILFGAVAGAWLCRHTGLIRAEHPPIKVSRRVGVAALAAFFGLLVGLPLLRELTGSQAIAMMEAFYRSGALVFGGGHVVLPLLQGAVVAPGWVGEDAFLAGYGAAQAVPGPLFTFAAYLGAVMAPPPNGVTGAVLGLVTIFLPGLLLHLGMLPFWEGFRRRAGTQAVMRGINASVVGLLGAALYSPIWTSAVLRPQDLAVALVGFILLIGWKAPPVVVVAVIVPAAPASGVVVSPVLVSPVLVTSVLVTSVLVAPVAVAAMVVAAISAGARTA